MKNNKKLYHEEWVATLKQNYPEFPLNLYQLLAYNALNYPEKGMYYVHTGKEDYFETYQQLFMQAKCIAQVLFKRGFRAGDRLITLVNDDRYFINIFWGCIFAGVIPAPLPTVSSNDDAKLENQRFCGVLKVLDAPVLCDSTKEKFYPAIQRFANAAGKAVICAEQLFIEAALMFDKEYVIRAVDEHATAVIQFSSGSTGVPKGVKLTHFNLIQNIKAKLAGELSSPKDTIVYWMPYFHDYGLFGCHLSALGGGMNQVKMTPGQFARSPLLWLKKLDQYQATITSSTNTGIEYTCNILKLKKKKIADNLDLSALRVLSVGAEMISVKAAKQFSDLLADYGFSTVAFLFGYGLTETVLAATGNSAGAGITYSTIDREALYNQKQIIHLKPDAPNSLDIAQVGFPALYSDVRIVDDTGKLCTPNTLGIVELKGDNVTSGYYNNDAANAAVFRDQWFNTGDVGFIDDQGALYITGRVKEMIIVGGHNYYPYDLEMIALAHAQDAFRSITICGVYDDKQNREEILCFFVPVKNKGFSDEGYATLLNNIKEVVNRLSGVNIDHFFKIKMNDIPRTTSGKISRKVFTEEYKKGTYTGEEVIMKDNLTNQTKQEHIEILKKIWQEVLGLSHEDLARITLQDSIFTLGCDSLQVMSIQGKMEQHYVSKFIPNFCYKYPSLKEQVDYLKQRDFSKEPPQNELEGLLLNIICRALHIEEHELGVTEDIIAKTSSLTDALQIMSKIKTAFVLGDEHEVVLRQKTIREMAQALQPLVLDLDNDVAWKQERGFPLMNFQETLYFHRKGFVKNEPSGLSCYIFLSLKIHGSFHKNVFQEAFNRLIAYHPVLRAVVDETKGRPEMKILSSVPEVTLNYADISNLSGEEQQQFLVAREIKNSDYRFEMDQFPLYFGEIYKLGDTEHVFMLNLEHLLIDGYSTLTMNEELFKIYELLLQQQPVEFIEQPLGFQHYVILEGIRQRTDTYQEALEYQVSLYQDFPENVQLPFKQNPSAIAEIFFDTLHRKFEPSTITALNAIAKKADISLNSLLLAAYFKTMHLWSQQDDLVINMPIFNRDHYFSGARRVIGTFIDIFPVRIKTFHTENVIQIAKKVESYVRAMLEIPVSSIILSRLAAKANAIQPRSLSSIIFSNSIGLYADQLSKLATIKVDTLSFRTGAPGTYIDLVLMDFEGEYYLDWNYVRGLFEDSLIEVLADQYELLLETIIKDSATGKGTQKFTNKQLIPLEYRQLLARVNATDQPYPVKTLDAWLAEQTKKTPGAIALTDQDQSITYQELDQRANQLATLLQARGLKPDNFVALLQQRKIEMIVAQLAVWKAGGAYVPIDPAYPQVRIAYMIKDCEATILIIQKDCLKSLGALSATNLQAIIINDGEKPPQFENEISVLDVNDIQASPVSTVVAATVPDNLAYMIYTSGSTGNPKGVMITHKKFCNFIYWVQQYHTINEKSQCALVTSYSFDMTLASNWVALISGSTLHLFGEENTRDPEKLLEFISEKGITFLNMTPSHFSLLSNTREMISQELLMSANLRVMLGGEVINTKDLNIWLKHYPQTHFTNEYGPTETTVASAYFPIPQNSENQIEITTVPIGKPLPNTQLYILNEAGEICMPGTVGYLYIGGDGVATGYYKKPAKTAKAFVPDSFNPQKYKTMYYTGDLARMWSDGNIEFLGRKDFQINLRGYRIECGEIEQNLILHPDVKEAVVTTRNNQEDLKVLVAFYTSITKNPVADGVLRSFLKDKLAEYAVPAFFQHLEQLPLNASGKIAINGLPGVVIEANTGSDNYVAPQTELQKQLVSIWETVLNIKNVGIHDNFWDIGGDSLSAMRLINKMKASGFGQFALRDAFEYRTVAAIATMLAQKKEQDDLTQENISFLKTPANPAVRIFCFPNSSIFATGEMFSSLAAFLPDSAEVLGANIPGHGNTKPLLPTIEAVVAPFLEFIEQKNDKPLYITGYSFGCLLAFELVKELEKRNCVVDGLIMLSAMAPDANGKHHFPQVSNEQMVQNLMRGGQTAVQMFERMLPEEIALNCQIVRNDLEAMMAYQYPGDKIATPVYLFQGELDQYSEATKQLINWEHYAHRVEYNIIAKAEHLFPETHTQILADKLWNLVINKEARDEQSLADLINL
ncbi:MAG: amino acid adenylation domain-containing protein [Desulfotomaculum sp.]|nr:amino acid adenylation domain-containing protein [Desulfotomaculum sp.]